MILVRVCYARFMVVRKSFLLPKAIWAMLLAVPMAAHGESGDKQARNYRAASPDALERIVVCTDGAIYRGEILEYEPRDHITLRLVSGKSKRIEWSNVKSSAAVGHSPIAAEHEQRSNSATPVRPPPVSASPSPTQPPRDNAPRVAGMRLPQDLRPYAKLIANLRVQSNQPEVDVQYLADSLQVDVWQGLVPMTVSAEKWQLACEAPCGVPVAKTAVFRIVGEEINTSANFTLPKQGHDFTLFVKGGSKSTRVAAWTVLVLGIMGGSIGTGMLSFVGSTDKQFDMTLGKASLGLLGSGAGMMLLSIPLFLGSRTGLTMRINDKDKWPARQPATDDSDEAVD